MKKSSVNKVCFPCGVTANYLTCLKKWGSPPKLPSFTESTYHLAKCDVCKKKVPVTEPRDFFYPDFTLIVRSAVRMPATLNTLVRDLTRVHPRPKSEVRKMLIDFANEVARQELL